jgi:hypothetical protein
MCPMANNTQNKTDIDNPILYLVSGVLEKGTDLKKGSLRPINSTNTHKQRIFMRQINEAYN